MSKRHRVEPHMTARARNLRRESPFPERLLWSRIRAGQLGGLRFRRQHPIGRYMADFYCPKAKLVIELDGLSHEAREALDEERTRFMELRGLRVVRFADDEVVGGIDGVVYRIACELGLQS